MSVGKSLTIVLLPNCVKENGGFFLFTPFEHDTQKLLIEARLLVYLLSAMRVRGWRVYHMTVVTSSNMLMS